LAVLHGHWALAQSASVELDQSAGYSSEHETAAGTQVRAFGEVRTGLRFNVEAAWGDRSGTSGDAFETAYPYGNQIKIVEAYAEQLFQPSAGILAVRAGRYRTPFGIYSASDQGYLGFLRSPLIRYETYYGLSNNALEKGLDVVAGVPRLSVEASVGAPADVGAAPRHDGFDAIVRGQATAGSFIIGFSHSSTRPNYPELFAHGRAIFSGVDARWMQNGVQLRGEWIWGKPFDGTTTDGGYLDLIVHRPSMGPITAVARVERLVYDAPAPFYWAASRQTVGGRIRLFNCLDADVELVHQTGQVSENHYAVDVGLTYSIRGDFRRHSPSLGAP